MLESRVEMSSEVNMTNDELIQIVIAKYPHVSAAEAGLGVLQAAKRDQGVDLIDAAVVSRKPDGKLHIHETEDVTPGRGATVGGILGGVLGIVAGPAGIVTGAAIGAVVGGATAELWDSGIPHKRLTEIGKGLSPGRAALVVLTETGYISFLESLLGGSGVELTTEAMNAEAARQLGHDHEVALKALTLGEALADGGMIETGSSS